MGKTKKLFSYFLLHWGRIKITNLLLPKIKDISKSISLSREPMNLQSVLLWVFLYIQILAFAELNTACLQTLFIKHYSFLFTSLELYSLVLNNWICSYLPRWCHLANVPRKIQFAPVFHFNVYIVSFQNKFYWLFILLIHKLCCLDLAQLTSLIASYFNCIVMSLCRLFSRDGTLNSAVDQTHPANH